jgi:hypothetical protein
MPSRSIFLSERSWNRLLRAGVAAGPYAEHFEFAIPTQVLCVAVADSQSSLASINWNYLSV